MTYNILSNKSYFKNKLEDKNENENHWVSVSLAQCKYEDNSIDNKCVIIEFMNCQNDIKFYFPLDYRCIRYSYSNTIIPSYSKNIKPSKHFSLFYDIYD